MNTPHWEKCLLRKFNIEIVHDFSAIIESDSDIENLNTKLENAKLEPQIKFVISTIAYVPEREFHSDSSDEEEDGTIDPELFKFDCSNCKNFPYSTIKPNFVDNNNIIVKADVSETKQGQVSEVVKPFLLKLSKNGFENSEDCSNNVSVSLALNRMKSLSSRRNKSVKLELKSKVETNIEFERFLFYWKCHWYNTNGEEVEYDEVRKYYKQLKRKDKEKSRKFLEIVESKAPVPYCELREFAKNSQYTRNLVRKMRTKYRDANIYLSLIDSDTVDFNGIYSAYLRIVNDCLKTYYSLPTVMSTGYEYHTDEEDGDAYKIASQVDMTIRTITAKHIPLGVYYPEPNMCILIPSDLLTISESFKGQERSGNTLESPNLMKQLKIRSGFISKFVKDRPIITTIPTRAKFTKSRKNQIRFSDEFKQRASPSKTDVKLFKQVTQSHFHEKVWLDNLFVNGAIKLINKELVYKHIKYTSEVQKCKDLLKSKKGTAEERRQELKQVLQNNNVSEDIIDAVTKKESLQHCKHLISAISNTEDIRKRDSLLTEAQLYINKDTLERLCEAIEEIRKYKSELLSFVRSFDEETLLKFIKNEELKINAFKRKHILRMSQSDVLELIMHKKLDLKKISKLGDNTIEDLLDETIVAHISLVASSANQLIEIFQLLETNSLVLSDFKSYNILRMIQPDVYDLIVKGILDLQKMSKLNFVLPDLLNKEIIQAITDKCTDVDSIMHIFEVLNNKLSEKKIKPKYILQIAQKAIDLVKSRLIDVDKILNEDDDIVKRMLDPEIIKGLESKELEFKGVLNLFKYIKECGLEFKDFKRNRIWRLSQRDVVCLIGDKKLNLKILSKLSNDVLEKLLDENIVKQIREGLVCADRMIVILELIKKNGLVILEPSYILEFAQMSVFDLVQNEVFCLNKIPGLDEELMDILMNEEIVNAMEETEYNKCLMCFLGVDSLVNFKREFILRSGNCHLPLHENRVYNLNKLMQLEYHTLKKLLYTLMANVIERDGTKVDNLIEILKLLKENNLADEIQLSDYDQLSQMAREDVYALIKNGILDLKQLVLVHRDVMEKVMHVDMIKEIEEIGYTKCLMKILGIDPTWNCKPARVKEMAHRYNVGLVKRGIYDMKTLSQLDNRELNKQLDKDFIQLFRNLHIWKEINPFQV